MLRRLLRPFVKQIHPDFHHNASATVKRTNEQSLQQLNTILDTLEHLGQGPQHAQRQQQQHRSLQPPSLEASYELTFHLVPSAKKKGAAESTHDVDIPSAAPALPPSFTARLTFPFTTLSRFAREAPFAPSSSPSDDAAAAPPPSALPEEIALQLRKLFTGARLPVPKELEAPGGGGGAGGHMRGCRGRSRREGLIGGREVENMVLADLMARDLKVEGPSENQRRAAVSRLLRSGRVMTKGLSGAEEAVALRKLEVVLVGEWERANLGEVSGGIQIVLDAESEMLHWDVLPDGRGHLILCPADVKGSRFRLASILRTIGGRRARGEGGREEDDEREATFRGGRVPDVFAGGL